jgi:hypothetical protein
MPEDKLIGFEYLEAHALERVLEDCLRYWRACTADGQWDASVGTDPASIFHYYTAYADEVTAREEWDALTYREERKMTELQTWKETTDHE